MVQPKLTVDLSGPFFRGDPSRTYLANLQRMLKGIAEEGERTIQSAYPVGPTGDGRRGVRGRVSSLTGRPWLATAVVSQTHVYPWPSSGQAQYRGGKTEARHHMFRDTARSLRSSRAILSANLTAGIE